MTLARFGTRLSRRLEHEIMLKTKKPDVGKIAMTAPKLDRRQVLKLEAAAMALAGGMTTPAPRPRNRWLALNARMVSLPA